MPARRQLVVGTAGHIDHGKSRLVWRLTGTNPDRLPEEQARGMTIDLGFAHCRIHDADVYFVDVPGHERFIRNMVAGATGIDLALLAVAADDSVMPQTREHAELLSLLGVQRCIVALTKADLVDDDWAAAVEDDVRGMLAQVGLTPLHVVRTSAVTGRGLDELRDALAAQAAPSDPPTCGAGLGSAAGGLPTWFRLPIDRAFTVPGRGTVVTGTVTHGFVQADDELELWPVGRRVRVRGLQSHSEGRDRAAGRLRLAVNLAGVAVEDVSRGCELATPGYLEAARCLDVEITRLRFPGKSARSRCRARLHLATSEVLVELRILSAETPFPALGQLVAANPIVATAGQRFILRDETGSKTLGGGRVLRPVSRPWSTRNPPDPDALRTLGGGSPAKRLEAAVRADGWRASAAPALASRAALPDAESVERLAGELLREGHIAAIGDSKTPSWVHARLLRETAEAIRSRMTRHLADHPRLAGVPLGEWVGWMPRACAAKLRAALADWMIRHGGFTSTGGFIVPRGHALAITPEDQRLLDAILREFEAAAFQPPELGRLTMVDARTAKRARELIDRAVARGELIRVADGMWLHANRWRELVQRVTAALTERGELTLSDLRTILGTTRKYMVPIAEYMDSVGLTRRVGDMRKLGPKTAVRPSAENHADPTRSPDASQDGDRTG